MINKYEKKTARIQTSRSRGRRKSVEVEWDDVEGLSRLRRDVIRRRYIITMTTSINIIITVVISPRSHVRPSRRRFQRTRLDKKCMRHSEHDTFWSIHLRFTNWSWKVILIISTATLHETIVWSIYLIAEKCVLNCFTSYSPPPKNIGLISRKKRTKSRFSHDYGRIKIPLVGRLGSGVWISASFRQCHRHGWVGCVACVFKVTLKRT